MIQFITIRKLKALSSYTLSIKKLQYKPHPTDSASVNDEYVLPDQPDCMVIKSTQVAETCHPIWYVPEYLPHRFLIEVEDKSNICVFSLLVDISMLTFIGSNIEDYHFDGITLLMGASNGYYIPRDVTTHIESTQIPQKLKNSYSLSTVHQIINVTKKIDEMQIIVKDKERQGEEYFAQHAESRANAIKNRTIRSNITRLDGEILKKTQENQELLLIVKEKQRILAAKKSQLKVLELKNQKEKRNLQSLKDGLELTKRQMNSIYMKLVKRQSQLICNISEIYPIQNNCIRNIPLPNSSFERTDKELTATGLGFTCHYVSMISLYLNIPLRYPMAIKSSRSVIYDFITTSYEGSKEFPLFQKGSDAKRFAYGVFLLNKNIEQLMNAIGIPIKDLRQTLVNIQTIQSVLNQEVMSKVQ
ncbi:hypothetical protein BC833DRAFT_157396 [Globomyces pollinis-pini]|nr:hypothetical protein BC833DRAFT_157396 [Globomyces pollinis-pini]